jgi:polyhydroxyalkanoate synthase
MLAGNGFRPLVVDWGTPGEDEKDFTLDDYVMQRLVPILDLPGIADNPVNVLGYCMGGLLALALATLRPEDVRTLTLMATPWDFHKPDPETGVRFTAMAEQLEPCLTQLGHLPVDILQSLFAGFQPLQALTKFIAFADLDPGSMEARRFVLLEDWLNDGVPLTANVARNCLRDWYGENKPAKLHWRIGGKIVDPRALTMPSYVVVPGRDRIVAPESARPLAKLLPHAALHEPMTGHIGMLASRKAPHQVWAPLAHWLEGHG